MDISISSVSSKSNYETRLSTRNKQIIADEPEELGGLDKGMTPKELLVSSLAACTNITLKMYLSRKDITGAISVDIELIEGEKPTLKRYVSIDADLDEKLQKRVLHVADRCPVHKLLEPSFNIETELK